MIYPRFFRGRPTVAKIFCLAKHQSGNNSGVIHAGIYYAPGTLKAKLCVRGLDLSYKFFDEHKVPYNKCGKVLTCELLTPFFSC